MSEPVRMRMAVDGIAVLTLDNPPVNTLATPLRMALGAALRRCGADPAVRGVVLASAGRMFSAGAEMREFGKPRLPPLLRDLIELIEALGKPVVAALHGRALGGGLELALGCHARVAAPGTLLGLPEVKRGILPGGGGTQRLPRLVGAEAALRMIAGGEPVTAEAALEMGLVEAVADGDLPDAACCFLATALAKGRPLPLARDRSAPHDPQALAAAIAEVRKRARGQAAPLACAEAVRLATELPLEEGLARERALFQELVQGEQSRALRHLFFAEREAQKVAGLPADIKPPPVRRAAVIGAGTMGGGIAMCFANAGIPVTVIDMGAAALQRGLDRCAQNWQRTVQGGRLDQAEVDRRRALLSGSTDLAALAGADVVVEAVFEDMALKQRIFAEIDRLADAGALLASNTSTLDIDRMAAATARPGDVLGLHFFSPANVMKLLEIVRGQATSGQSLARGVALGGLLGKVPVVVGNCDGFVANRMTGRRGAQAERLLQEGALPQQVDAAMTEFGYPMGPFAVGDLAGLDIGAAARRRRGAVFPVADALVAEGRLGQKTGRGYYRYAEGSRKAEPDPEVAALIARVAAGLGVPQRRHDAVEIRERLILPMVNEGARILEEGIAACASDIDVIFVHAFGWPAWRGGPMFWADALGLATVRDRLAHYASLTGDETLQPAPLIQRLAAAGGSLLGGVPRAGETA
jgi:3-hydroxyacyl-CoA dehydrogenase